jgi:hypothetical protein
VRLWRCGKACNSRAFRPQTVYTRPPFPGGFRLLLAVNLLGAGRAIFCPPGAGENARAADFAAAKSFWVEDGCGRRSMGSSLCIFALLCDELCVRWVVQRDEGGLSLPFFKYQRRKMSPLSKKRGHHDLRILGFDRIASTAAVRTRSDFGIIPSPLHLARSLLFRRQPIMNHSVVGACFLHELQIKTVQHSTDGYAEQHP